MHPQDRLEKGWHLFTRVRKPAARLTPRRLRGVSILALVIMLAISGAGGLPPVQAAQYYEVGIERYVQTLLPFGAEGLDRVCVGEFVVIRVVADRILANTRTTNYADGTERTNPSVQVGGVTVDGSVGNPDVGALTPATRVTALRANPPGSAGFVFEGKNPGLTELSFKGRIEGPFVLYGDYIPFTMDARVVNCKFAVTTVSIWRVPGEAQLALVAIIHEAKIVLDNQGRFSGPAQVTWTGGASPVGDCSAAVAVGDSQANLTGVMDSYGYLILDITFQPASVAISGNCTNGIYPVTADPLHLEVPSSGGSDTLRQVLQGPEMMRGGAHILVLPFAEPGGD